MVIATSATPNENGDATMTVKLTATKRGWMALNSTTLEIVAWDATYSGLLMTVKSNGWTVAR